MNTQREVLTGARRVSIILTIIFLSIAAIIGIIALLTGEWGTLQTKIIGTTLLAAALSIVLLVHLSIFEQIPKILFWFTLILGAISFVASIVMLWYEWNWSAYVWPNEPDWYQYYELLWKVIWLGWLYSAYLTHLNLLLIVKRTQNTVIQVVFWATMLVSTAIVVILSILIFTDGDFWFEGLDRILGTLLILWVLGTIVMPILGRVFQTRTQQPQRLGNLELPQELITHLHQQAAARGLSVEQYLHMVSTTNQLGNEPQP